MAELDQLLEWRQAEAAAAGKLRRPAPGRRPAMDIHAMVKGNDIDGVRAYIRNRGNLNARNPDGQTPLIVAGLKGRTEIAKLLIDAKADVNAAASEGLTALMAAVAYGTDIVPMLIAAKCDLNKQEKVNGFSALIGAAWQGNVTAVRLLVDARAKVNLKANLDRTALMAASAKGYAMIVRLLLEAKADVNIKDKQGNTALSGAKRAGHTEIVSMLKAAGAKG
jgi:ankyrin repeat protein